MLLLLGCSVTGQGSVRPDPAPVSSTATALLQLTAPQGDDATLRQEGGAHWLKRGSRAELEASIAAWEQVAARNPGDVETRVSLARALHLLADGHLRDEGGVERAVNVLERGAAYALEALLASSPALKSRVDAGTPVEGALEVLDSKSVPALYWYALSLRTSSDLQGPSAIVRSAARIKQMMEACVQLDGQYYFAGPQRYLAVFYARAPFIAGGDLKKSQEHFQRVLEVAPGYLATRVFWAEFYALKVGDAQGFQRELEYVLAQPDDIHPELIPENAIAKRRAKALLDRKAELF